MFGLSRSVRLFTIFGFQVKLDASWLVLAFLIAWTLAVGLFPFQTPGLARGAYWWMGVAGAIGLFLSIVWHELCHSLVARRYGLPMRGITLFIFGGVAEMSAEPPNARVEFLMAIAGPVSSLVLSGVCAAIHTTLRGYGPVAPLAVIAYLAWVNMALALFNLIPAFPLDGGRVLRAALWQWRGNLPRATRIASRIGSGFGIALMALGVVQLFFGSLISAVWWFLIGMFLRGASEASYQQLMIREALRGEPVRRFMNPEPVTVPPELSLRRLVEDYVYRYHHRMFPVVEQSHLVGCVSTEAIRALPPEEWDRHSVSEVARPCSVDNTISPDADAAQALAAMNQTGNSRLMVVEGDRLVAIVALKDLLGFLALKLDLEAMDRHPPLPSPR